MISFWGINTSAQIDVITPQEFKDLMKSNTEMVLLDANKSKGYKAAHIKGAIYVNHNNLYRDGDIKGLIKSPEVLAAMFGDMGVGGNNLVVVTDDGSQKYSSRVYWILKYLGYDNVKIMHKNKELWRKAKLPLTSVPGTASPNVFIANVQPSLMATIEDIDASMANADMILVDARTPEEYKGNHKNSEGHIPQAVSLNYEDLLDDRGYFKSTSEIKEIVEGLGLTPDKELIFYCRTSVRAGVPFFVFKNILGYDNVKVYDGAYLEWYAKREVVQ